TIIIERGIVAGMEYFIIPIYNGIKAIPEAAIAFINTEGMCCKINELVSTFGIKSNLSLIIQKVVVIKAF
ncbi:hypothetical protein, partial [Lysinibacillus sp. D4B2_S17]|uniref:hypothetical protein n=1 Tax=Lysinibacillus sp. D4B2_S17 TaxID=2941225 RepID=UPI0020BEB1E0